MHHDRCSMHVQSSRKFTWLNCALEVDQRPLFLLREPSDVAWLECPVHVPGCMQLTDELCKLQKRVERRGQARLHTHGPLLEGFSSAHRDTRWEGAARAASAPVIWDHILDVPAHAAYDRVHRQCSKSVERWTRDVEGQGILARRRLAFSGCKLDDC
jgi:hypothetical protein